MKNIYELKNEYNSVSMSDEGVRKMRNRMADAKAEKVNASQKSFRGFAIAAAAALAIIIVPNTGANVAKACGEIPVVGGLFKAVTFRDYHYEDDTKNISVEAQEIVAEHNTSDVDAINAEMKDIIDGYINEFNAELNEKGYKDVQIKSETVNTTDKYFTLKLSCFIAQADGAEEVHYYTLDRQTGKKLELADLFKEDSNYVKTIADYISDEMRNEMKNDENVSYWVDDETEHIDMEDEVRNAAFYIDENGQIVLVFQQGDVAPMSMGTIYKTIPAETIKEMLK